MGAKHTTGPWTVTGSGGRWEQRLSIRADNWGCVAHIGVDRGLPHWDEPQRANARLIAAAPQLLEALQTTAANLRSWKAANGGGIKTFDSWLEVVEEAIAKAEGGAA